MSDREILRELAIRANNIIMKGSYSGDDIHEASQVMNWCIELVKVIDSERKASKTNGSTTK